MEVLVVDNASADDTVEMVEAKFPWVKLIKSKENLGFAKGNNVAIRQCQGRYIALVNPDVIVFPGLLGRACGLSRSESESRECGAARFQSGHDSAKHLPTVSYAMEQLLFCDPPGKRIQRAPFFRRRAHVLLPA